MSLKLPVKRLKPEILIPDFSREELISGDVCGIDEVGRGPLCGPVIAACVFVPDKVKAHEFWSQITDSKKLSQKKREMLYPLITQHCHYGIGKVSAAGIDKLNIHHATLKAMKLAYKDMGMPCDHALIDGKFCPDIPCDTTAIVKGDSKSLSIAAASIIAKVTRDQLMARLHNKHPHYGWDTNAGYGTKAHIAGLQSHGITKHHRKSFAPVRALI